MVDINRAVNATTATNDFAFVAFWSKVVVFVNKYLIYWLFIGQNVLHSCLLSAGPTSNGTTDQRYLTNAQSMQQLAFLKTPFIFGW